MRAHQVVRGTLHSGSNVTSSGPAVLAVVGEHRTDPTRLLLLGDDGVYYTYCDGIDDPIAVELTTDWVVDIAHAA